VTAVTQPVSSGHLKERMALLSAQQSRNQTGGRNSIMDKQLEEIRDWAKAKVASGEEPPWAWFQYMKLIEIVDAILGGQVSVTTMENLRQSGPNSAGHLHLVGSISPQDSGQHPLDIPQIPMPM
jgi:hypothetical protein